MGVDRSLVVGYGFLVTSEEAEAFDESLDEPHDGSYEALFYEIQLKNPGIEVHGAGNEWEGEAGYLIALASGSSEVHAGGKGTGMLGMYEFRSLIPDGAEILYKLRTQVLPGNIDRFVGWYAGIYTR
jgi:hypothetical protein